FVQQPGRRGHRRVSRLGQGRVVDHTTWWRPETIYLQGKHASRLLRRRRLSVPRTCGGERRSFRGIPRSFQGAPEACFRVTSSRGPDSMSDPRDTPLSGWRERGKIAAAGASVANRSVPSCTHWFASTWRRFWPTRGSARAKDGPPSSNRSSVAI